MEIVDVRKIDDNKIEVIKQESQPEPISEVLDYDYLINQRANLQNQIDILQKQVNDFDYLIVTFNNLKNNL